MYVAGMADPVKRVVFSTERASCERLSGVLNKLDATVMVADLPAPDGRIGPDWLAQPCGKIGTDPARGKRPPRRPELVEPSPLARSEQRPVAAPAT